MAIEKQGWITVDEIVNLYLDITEQSIHKYYKCWNIAFTGMENLGLDFFYRVITKMIKVSASNTVRIPADCINVTKIGWLNSVGEVVPLKLNENLTNLADLLPDRLAKIQGQSLFNFYSLSSPTFYNYWNGDVFMNLYGLPADSFYPGQFKIDRTNGVILLDNCFVWPDLVLEYIASPQEGETYYIPIQFKEALMAYLGWKDIQFMASTRKGGLGDKQQRKNDFYNERRLAYARFNPFSLDEAYQLNIEAQRLCVKV